MLVTGSLIHLIFEAAGGFFGDLTSNLAPLLGGLTALSVLLVGLLQGYWKKWHPIWTGFYLVVFGIAYTFIYWVLPNAGYGIGLVPMIIVFLQIPLEFILCGARGPTIFTAMALCIFACTLDSSWITFHNPKYIIWTDLLPSMFAIYPALSLQVSFYISQEDHSTFPPAIS
jgi:hypothetical protein